MNARSGFLATEAAESRGSVLYYMVAARPASFRPIQAEVGLFFVTTCLGIHSESVHLHV